MGKPGVAGVYYEPAFKPLHDLGSPAVDLPRFQTELGKSDGPGVRPEKSKVYCVPAGDRPAGARVRSPVVRMAGWRETKILKPIDKALRGESCA